MEISQVESALPVSNAHEPSRLPLDKYLLELKKNLTQNSSEQNENRIRNIVTMCRRFRGASPSDQFGYFGGRGNSWLFSRAHNDLISTNLYQSLIRGAAANYLSTSVRLDVAAAQNTPRFRRIEKIARGIYRAFDQRDWDEII